MAGTAILARIEFSGAQTLVGDVARYLKEKGILTSDIPIASGKCWSTFQASPRTELVTITFRHWDGKLFPVTNGGLNMAEAPRATFVAVLDDSIEDANEEIVSAMAEVLGIADLEQTYTDP